MDGEEAVDGAIGLMDGSGFGIRHLGFVIHSGIRVSSLIRHSGFVI
jgi:hypothetical protein